MAPLGIRACRTALSAAALFATCVLAGTSSACTITAADRTVVVTGATPATAGSLCMSTEGGRDCRAVRADPQGVIVADSNAPLAGPSWMEEAPRPGITNAAACSVLPPTGADGLKPLVIALLSALFAFLSGMTVAIFPKWLERRHHSRELAMGWVGEYLQRLSAFERSASANADPLPLPLLGNREAHRLSAIATRAGEILGAAGYLRASSEQERRALVAPIVAGLRRYPGKLAEGSETAGASRTAAPTKP
ncbi:hypothetical protein [Sphingomonas sp.]|uniref:hypothetical protein n=1 Tax=Sphingomonas sp. TaxID=28214 RepID=UPI0025CBC7FB|nr:hypothetical protein [Sphingomonas sp.]